MNDKPPWATVVGQYSSRGTPESGELENDEELLPADDEPGYVAFGTISSNRRAEPMIQIKRRTGEIEAFGYPYLTRVQFNRSEGLKIDFTQCRIHVRGRNLHKALDALTAHRVRYIQEFPDRMDHLSQDETVVTEIEIERT